MLGEVWGYFGYTLGMFRWIWDGFEQKKYIYICNINTVKYSVFGFLTLAFLFNYGVPEAPEVSKNLPGARSSVLTEYEPISCHGDPIRHQYYNLDVHFPDVHISDVHIRRRHGGWLAGWGNLLRWAGSGAPGKSAQQSRVPNLASMQT